MIVELLNSGNIKAKVKAETWEEAGRIAGQLLVDIDGVGAEYIEATLDSVRKYGPYIVIAPGVALFHARPQDGVKKICMSFITLKDGVNFNAGDKDPVKLVFAFGATDNKTHLTALSELMVILKDKEVMQKLECSENELQIMELLKNKLEYRGD
ncbi:MAG: PTS sugar transporter subunit IIA [Clostridia bacterium]